MDKLVTILEHHFPAQQLFSAEPPIQNYCNSFKLEYRLRSAYSDKAGHELPMNEAELKLDIIGRTTDMKCFTENNQGQRLMGTYITLSAAL